MAEPGQFTAPVVRGAASLHRHDAGRQGRHKLRELRPRQLLTKQDAAVGSRPMNLDHLLCQVDPDDANLIHGCLLPLW